MDEAFLKEDEVGFLVSDYILQENTMAERQNKLEWTPATNLLLKVGLTLWLDKVSYMEV